MNIKDNIKKVLGMKEESGSIYTKDHFRNTNFKVGDYSYGAPRIFFANDEATLEIGKFCSISSGVEIYLGGNHRTDWITTYPFNVLNSDFPNAVDIIGHPATKGNVKIMNDVWIGGSVTILSGVTIGNGAVLGNHSVVTKDVGAYEIWVGNPAKLVKRRFSDDDIKFLQELKWWDWDIQKINLHVKELCSGDFDALRKKLNIS